MFFSYKKAKYPYLVIIITYLILSVKDFIKISTPNKQLFYGKTALFTGRFSFSLHTRYIRFFIICVFSRLLFAPLSRFPQ